MTGLYSTSLYVNISFIFMHFLLDGKSARANVKVSEGNSILYSVETAVWIITNIMESFSKTWFPKA